jgi:hypothetical protein
MGITRPRIGIPSASNHSNRLNLLGYLVGSSPASGASKPLAPTKGDQTLNRNPEVKALGFRVFRPVFMGVRTSLASAPLSAEISRE